MKDKYKKFLILFDKEGSGQENIITKVLEEKILSDIVDLGISKEDVDCIII